MPCMSFRIDRWGKPICHPLTISTIESISVTPDPPKPGQNLTVHVEATANDEIKVGVVGAVSRSGSASAAKSSDRRPLHG